MPIRMMMLLKDRSGASAVEFAILTPLFLLVLLTMAAFGIYLSAASSVQQIASDAARTAVAGLDQSEREALAKNFIAQSTLDYYLLNSKKFSVAVAKDPKNANQFTVSLEYDAADLPIWNLYSFVMPDSKIRRFSTIRIGGI